MKLLLISLIIGTQAASLLGQKEALHSNEFQQQLSQKAVDAINEQSNDLYKWTLVSLDDVDQQMVSGVKYTLHLTLARTDCTKQLSQKDRTDCKQSNEIKKCTVSIYHRPWDGTEDINVVGCEEPSIRKKRQTIRHRYSTMSLIEDIGHTHHIKPKDYITYKRFSNFAALHEKEYTSKREVLRRFHVFKKNLKRIHYWQKAEQGTAVYGVTKFSDMTSIEWKTTYLPYVWDQPVVMNKMANLKDQGIDLNDDLPESFDWRDHGAVTDVKNQGNCGSCWAFSTTGNIEGQWFLSKKKLVSLAEQQLVDCDTVDSGCNGGLPSQAYREIIRMGGLEPEEDYPYDAKDEKCHLVRKEIAVYINDSVELPHDELAMQAWLVKKGPISIGINATPLQFYRHGIHHPFKIFCSPTYLNHGVLIVGYGEEKNKPFWSIKNSWGANWGEKGYYRLYRGKNVCGVQQMPTTAIVK